MNTNSSGVVGLATRRIPIGRYDNQCGPQRRSMSGRGWRIAADRLIAERFMSQMAPAPLLFCSTASVFPSPLKSPVPTACHAEPGSATTPDLKGFCCSPFISQALSLDEVHAFWRKPNDMNKPVTYVDAPHRSLFLVERMRQYVPLDGNILEIGCNVGRNLNFLMKAGYTRLTRSKST